jgi:hypothetical protein
MANRYERNTAVLFKLETTYNTDSLPVPATDALLLRKFTSKPIDAKYVNVPEIRDYFGGAIDLIGASWISGSFDVSLGGSGAAGTVTQWGKLLRAAGFAEVVTALTRVDYTLISTALESGSLYYYDDGVLKKALGLRVNITSFKMGYGDVPMISCSFMALDGGVATAANPALTLSAWKTPLPINTTNSGQLTLGCTYAAGALVGGTAYPSKGIELQLGGKLSYMDLLGGEAIDFTDRNVTGKITLDLTAAQEIANEAIVKAGTTTGIGLLHGTVAGGKLLVFCPNVQLKNPSKQTLNGRRVIDYEINPVPTIGTGNDEWRIVTL